MDYVGEIDDVEVFRHPQENLDGNPLWYVEYYDKTGKTVFVEYFHDRREAYMAALMAMDAKII